MERVLDKLFSPIAPPRNCLAYHFLQAVGKKGMAMNKTTLTTTQGIIILALIALLFGGAMELTGKPAPNWMTSVVAGAVLYLAGVATPTHDKDDKKKE